MLKNETIIESPEDVNGILELCHVLIKDQSDSAQGANSQPSIKDIRRAGPYHHGEREEIAEEQGWVARMVHLFRAESLDVQFEVCMLLDRSIVNTTEVLLSYCKLPVDTSKRAAIGCASLTLHSSLRPSNYVDDIRIGNI